MSPLEQLVCERTELDPAALGAGTVDRASQTRMQRLDLTEPADYVRLLECSAAEWLELLQLVVVAETWFYRDRGPFEAFIRLAKQEWLPAHPGGRMRILSVPCSSGEEPYSVVMGLLDADIPCSRFQVEAADISPRAIARARAAVYGRNSFRGTDLDFRVRHFRQTSDGYALNPEVRDTVRFFEANLLAADFLAGQPPFDFVFCRNLLMYLNLPGRAKALNTLQRLLTPSGILLVGAAEQSLAMEHGFLSAELRNAFACRKRSPARRESGADNSEGNADSGLLPRQVAGTATASLERARRLADTGELQKARIACEAHLRSDSTSVQGWYLLGLLREAATDATAIECYRRALYLDPNHYESLLQMALRSEQDGDLPRARLFRNRAQRAQNGRLDL
jgi:chemotaxis protein methyltransferase WspC